MSKNLIFQIDSNLFVLKDQFLNVSVRKMIKCAINSKMST